MAVAFVVLIVWVTTHLRAERPQHAWLWPLIGGVAAVLVFTAFMAVGDAYLLRHNNCWVVDELKDSDTAWSVWACAPGRHQPHEFEDLETEFDGRLTQVVGGSSRTCDFYDQQLIAAGDVPFGLDVEQLQRLPASDYWLCEETVF